MKLRYEMDGVRYYQGDARYLTAIADNSVQMIITSPPYFQRS